MTFRVRKGERISADKINRATDVGKRIASGPGMSVQALGEQVGVRNTRREGKGVRKPAFAKVVSVHDDYVLCKFYNPVSDTEGDEVLVAKPFVLRRSPFDGQTITYVTGQIIEYTYDDESSPEYTRMAEDTVTEEAEEQFLLPSYFVGEVLRIVPGNTGVTVGEGESAVGIGWEDINTAGRMWATEGE